VVKALAWLPDSTHIVSGGPTFGYAGLLCWNARTGQVVCSYSESVRALTCSPQSHIAFVADIFRIREFPAGKLLHSTVSIGNISSQAVSALAWSPDGNYIACGTDNGTIILWDVISRSIFARSRLHGSGIHSLAWSPDSKYLVLGCDDAKMCVLGLAYKTAFLQKKPQPVLEEAFTYAGNYQSEVTSVAWSPDGGHIAGNIGGKIYVCPSGSGKGVWYGGHEASVNFLAWSPDSQYIASGDSDHIVRIWEVATGSAVATYSEHNDRINAIAWSPDGNYLASGSQDHTIRVWAAP
jgi:WD40 repeat protein